MVSLVGETWRGQTFKALESISISANCRLRKIFTMKVQPPDDVGDDGKNIDYDNDAVTQLFYPYVGWRVDNQTFS